MMPARLVAFFPHLFQVVLHRILADAHVASDFFVRHPLNQKIGEAHEHVWSYRVWPSRILYRRVGTEWLDGLTIEHRRDVYR